MKKLFEVIPCVTLCLALGAFSIGCACNKSGSSDACCGGGGDDCCKNGGDCKDDCKSGGACKDGDKSQHQAEPAPAPQVAPATAPAAQSTAPINKLCPIGEHAIDPTLTVAYQGKTIAFCCEDCRKEFQGMDDSGKAGILAKASAN